MCSPTNSNNKTTNDKKFDSLVSSIVVWDNLVFQRQQPRIHKRVCLELHSVVKMKMLYKRWKSLWKINNHVEVERTELAND
jgi:hypothetical protein